MGSVSTRLSHPQPRQSWFASIQTALERTCRSCKSRKLSCRISRPRLRAESPFLLGTRVILISLAQAQGCPFQFIDHGLALRHLTELNPMLRSGFSSSVRITDVSPSRRSTKASRPAGLRILTFMTVPSNKCFSEPRALFSVSRSSNVTGICAELCAQASRFSTAAERGSRK